MSSQSLIDVTAGVIQRDGKILICQRPQGKSCEFLWEFPGGKVEPGESLEACLQRELQEELDIRVENLQPLTTIEKPSSGIRLHFFTCQLKNSHDPTRIEHKALAWVDGHDFENYSFCPSDEQMILTVPAWRLFDTSDHFETDD